MSEYGPLQRLDVISESSSRKIAGRSSSEASLPLKVPLDYDVKTDAAAYRHSEALSLSFIPKHCLLLSLGRPKSEIWRGPFDC